MFCFFPPTEKPGSPTAGVNTNKNQWSLRIDENQCCIIAFCVYIHVPYMGIARWAQNLHKYHFRLTQTGLLQFQFVFCFKVYD